MIVKALTFDYVAGNLYGISASGIIFVCKAAPLGELACTGVIESLELGYDGIALNPTEGYIVAFKLVCYTG